MHRIRKGQYDLTDTHLKDINAPAVLSVRPQNPRSRLLLCFL
jgi:hypothetical protein